MGNHGDEAKQDGYIAIFREANAYRVRYKHYTGDLYERMLNSEDEVRKELEALEEIESTIILPAKLEQLRTKGSVAIEGVMLSVNEAKRYFPGPAGR